MQITNGLADYLQINDLKSMGYLVQLFLIY